MKKRSSAFTLIELLVVIAILALLIAILLPNLRQARETARMVACQSNQKQMAYALNFYHNENKDYWPADHLEVSGSWISWVPRLRKVLGGDHTVAQIFKCASTPRDFAWQSKAKTSGTMPPACREIGYDDLNEQGLFYGVSTGGAKVYFGYGYNGWGAYDFNNESMMLGLGGHCDSKAKPLPADQKWMREVKNSDVVMPNQMYAIADSIGDGNWDTWISPQSYNANTGFPSNGVGPRHLGRANMMYADLSVQLINPKDAMIVGVNIDDKEKERRISRWNRQGKAINLGQNY
ncbi:MAG: hypothetical protein AMXMBFR58_05460 [Phycisphaerae bacterium]|nr:hypothetical protein [Phycisphaerales bacterium]MCK6478226.1 DUF1559 domain-containing protein [Phycisphaerales bacterium]